MDNHNIAKKERNKSISRKLKGGKTRKTWNNATRELKAEKQQHLSILTNVLQRRLQLPLTLLTMASPKHNQIYLDKADDDDCK